MSIKKLYTVVLDYRGGTYIAQVVASSFSEVLPLWLSKIENKDLQNWKISRKALADIIKTESLIPIDGCINVWCISGSSQHGLVLINLVATEHNQLEPLDVQLKQRQHKTG